LALGTSLADQTEAQASLAEAALESYTLATLRYEAGVDAYLSKLDAQRSSASARQELIAVRLARAGNLLTLYKALGGGWSKEEAQDN
ncbi:MAG: multidrug transporter, partial [Humidesulfovibrio sp.]|nr:multidrug transporter [Humidesulfovibrio sp.]